MGTHHRRGTCTMYLYSALLQQEPSRREIACQPRPILMARQVLASKDVCILRPWVQTDLLHWRIVVALTWTVKG